MDDVTGQVQGDEQGQSTTSPAKEETLNKVTLGQGDDEESDLEDLDDVLDDFSASKKPSHQKQNEQTSSQPTEGLLTESSSEIQNETKQGQDKSELGFDEEAFLKQLEAGMADLMGPAAVGEGSSTKSTTAGAGGFPQLPGNEDWNALSEELSNSGLRPADLMKLMMGDELAAALDGKGGIGNNIPNIDGPSTTKAAAAPVSSSSSLPAGGSENNFQETIQKTMQRMQESGDKATVEVNESGDDDMLNQILKAMEGVDGAGDADFDKVIMGIMQQLSNKEMLYEPLKELDDKFGPWLKDNREGLDKEDLEKYELQAAIVSDIIAKFEEKGYSDDNTEHRAYIWEKMQKMQAAGSPPEDLISKPLEDAKIFEQLGGSEGCPQQ